MSRKLLAEALGTAFLLIGVVGSGIMAEDLSGGNIGLALLANAISTGAVLFVIITVFAPVSGAHFNPAVTLVFWLKRDIDGQTAGAYVLVQIIAGALGVWATHAMFGLDIWQLSQTDRSGAHLWWAEVVATFGLVLTILGGLRARPEAVPALVAFYITGAYWFTASTSFANPAVTIARALSDTFAGINPAHMPLFVIMQIIGATVALSVGKMVFMKE